MESSPPFQDSGDDDSPPHRQRGRPRKSGDKNKKKQGTSVSDPNAPKKKRGRPKSKPPPPGADLTYTENQRSYNKKSTGTKKPNSTKKQKKVIKSEISDDDSDTFQGIQGSSGLNGFSQSTGIHHSQDIVIKDDKDAVAMHSHLPDKNTERYEEYMENRMKMPERIISINDDICIIKMKYSNAANTKVETLSKCTDLLDKSTQSFITTSIPIAIDKPVWRAELMPSLACNLYQISDAFEKSPHFTICGQNGNICRRYFYSYVKQIQQEKVGPYLLVCEDRIINLVAIEILLLFKAAPFVVPSEKNALATALSIPITQSYEFYVVSHTSLKRFIDKRRELQFSIACIDLTEILGAQLHSKYENGQQLSYQWIRSFNTIEVPSRIVLAPKSLAVHIKNGINVETPNAAPIFHMFVPMSPSAASQYPKKIVDVSASLFDPDISSETAKSISKELDGITNDIPKSIIPELKLVAAASKWRRIYKKLEKGLIEMSPKVSTIITYLNKAMYEECSVVLMCDDINRRFFLVSLIKAAHLIYFETVDLEKSATDIEDFRRRKGGGFVIICPSKPKIDMKGNWVNYILLIDTIYVPTILNSPGTVLVSIIQNSTLEIVRAASLNPMRDVDAVKLYAYAIQWLEVTPSSPLQESQPESLLYESALEQETEDPHSTPTNLVIQVIDDHSGPIDFNKERMDVIQVSLKMIRIFCWGHWEKMARHSHNLLNAESAKNNAIAIVFALIKHIGSTVPLLANFIRTFPQPAPEIIDHYFRTLSQICQSQSRISTVARRIEKLLIVAYVVSTANSPAAITFGPCKEIDGPKPFDGWSPRDDRMLLWLTWNYGFVRFPQKLMCNWTGGRRPDELELTKRIVFITAELRKNIEKLPRTIISKPLYENFPKHKKGEWTGPEQSLLLTHILSYGGLRIESITEHLKSRSTKELTDFARKIVDLAESGETLPTVYASRKMLDRIARSVRLFNMLGETDIRSLATDDRVVLEIVEELGFEGSTRSPYLRMLFGGEFGIIKILNLFEEILENGSIYADYKDEPIELPISAADSVLVLQYGMINPKYCNEDYIFPIGYKTTSEYKGIATSCEIRDGGDRPMFVVKTDSVKESIEATGADPDIAWQKFMEMFDKTLDVSGYELFGLCCPKVLKQIQTLQNADKCSEYRERFFLPKPRVEISKSSDPPKPDLSSLWHFKSYRRSSFQPPVLPDDGNIGELKISAKVEDGIEIFKLSRNEVEEILLSQKDIPCN